MSVSPGWVVDVGKFLVLDSLHGHHPGTGQPRLVHRHGHVVVVLCDVGVLGDASVARGLAEAVGCGWTGRYRGR